MIIRSEKICKKANSIVKSCETRDTLKIARELGIHLHFLDNLNDLLGMYTYRHKERHILLNSNMEYLIMQMVCGHEIGHDTFHRDLAKGNEPLPEFVLFDRRRLPPPTSKLFRSLNFQLLPSETSTDFGNETFLQSSVERSKKALLATTVRISLRLE